MVEISVLGVLLLGSMKAQETTKGFCALIVDTKPNTVVSIYRKDKYESHHQRATNGRAEFCDLPTGAYEVRLPLGGNCGEVLFPGVMIAWPEQITIRGDVSFCQDLPQIFGGCALVLRIRDVYGSPVANAEVRTPDGRLIRRTDRFGRFMDFLGKEPKVYSLNAEDFHTKTIRLTCEDRMYGDQTVILDRKR
jgi:hypothetical protein